MAILVALVVLGAAVGWLWWVGALEGLADRVRDGLAVFYPSRPLSRRALPRKVLRAAARTVTVGVSGTALLPTRIEVSVNPADLEPFADALEWLGQDVATALRKRASDAGWMVPAGPEVVVTPDEDRPLRMPRATGHIGALRPDDLRSLRTGEAPVVPEPDAAGAAEAARPDGAGNGIPTGYTGSAPTQASSTRTMPPHAAGSSPAGAPGGAPSLAPTGRTTPVVPTAAARPSGQTAPTAAMRTLHLRLVSGQAAEADLSALLTGQQAPLVLGRSRQAELRVRDRHVSGRHCAFSLKADDGTLTVEDLQSTNGTFVGGQRVRRATLRPGDVLRVGDSSWRVALDGVTTDPGGVPAEPPAR